MDRPTSQSASSEDGGTAATRSTAAVLECSGLVKRFGDRTVVDGVGFTIAAGETYGLLGPNGAGKTTTISMVCGLLPANEGLVFVAGLPVSASAVEAKSHIGLVPQDVALYPDLSARENLSFFAKLQGLSGAELKVRVDEVLEIIGLTDRAGEKVETYSGGMKRRCNIGAGLLHRPDLLILDEPTVGVDPQSRNAILESIEALGGAGLAVLYTTHYMEEAERLCDRVGIIDEGRLVVEGTRRELVDQVGEHAHIRVSGIGDPARLATACEQIDGVEQATLGGDGVELLVRDARSLLAPIVDAAEAVSFQVAGVDVVEPTLETVFLHLTGKALRE